ncbi:unnamed protein product [Calypogeia fissa]
MLCWRAGWVSDFRLLACSPATQPAFRGLRGLTFDDVDQKHDNEEELVIRLNLEHHRGTESQTACPESWTVFRCSRIIGLFVSLCSANSSAHP